MSVLCFCQKEWERPESRNGREDYKEQKWLNEISFLCSALLVFSLTLPVNSSVSLPITDDTGVVFKHVAFSLQKSHNGSPWFSVSPKLFNNIIHSERCAIPTVWVKDFLCTSQNPPGGYIMLFALSVQMKPKTIYYHPDIASHWQITLLLLEWWLGMAEQKFMNSQCGRLGRESGWRSWRHKAKRQLVFLFLCHGIRKCFIFCGEKEIQRTELTFIEAKWWTIWFRKGTVSGDVMKAVISSDRGRGRECWYPWPVNCSLCQMYIMGSSEVLCSPRTVNTALSKSMTHWNEISFKLDLSSRTGHIKCCTVHHIQPFAQHFNHLINVSVTPTAIFHLTYSHICFCTVGGKQRPWRKIHAGKKACFVVRWCYSIVLLHFV